MSFIFHPHFREKRVKLGVSFLLAAGFLYLFSPFLVPILLSVIFAFALEPTIAKFSPKKVARLRLTCLSLIFLAILVASAPFAVVSVLAYAELNHISSEGVNQNHLYQSFQHFRSMTITSLDGLAHDLKLQSLFRAAPAVDQAIGQFQTFLSNAAPTFITSMPFVALSFLVFNITLFLFLFKARTIKAIYLKSKFLRRTEMCYVIFSLQASCRATLISTVLTGLMHASLFAFGSWVFHVGEPVLIFPLTFFCSFLPVIGTLPVTLFLIGASFIQHHLGAAAGLFGISFLTWTLDYMIRVYWMVDESRRIHPALSFVAILGAIIHFGLAGVIYGPLCISLAAMIIPKFLSNQKKQRASKSTVTRLHPVAAVSAEQEEQQDPATALLNQPTLKPDFARRPWMN